MADRTSIEWTDATWNPVRGCSRVSPGCQHCYAELVAARFSGPGQAYEGLARRRRNGDPQWTGKVVLVEQHLTDPLRWRRPRRIFVNSMSDLFHERLPDEAIDRVFAVMALAPRHTFQVLTKRPERMLAYLMETWQPAIGQSRGDDRRDRVLAAVEAMVYGADREDFYGRNEFWTKEGGCVAHAQPWPLPNVWLGTSVEDQQRADERIPLLLDTPAAVRFISAEPLLGPVDLASYLVPAMRVIWGDTSLPPAERRRRAPPLTAEDVKALNQLGRAAVKMNGQFLLDWVIAGGESGPGARPMHPKWARKLRDQCVAAGVPFFFKQWGAYGPIAVTDGDDPDGRSVFALPDGTVTDLDWNGGPGPHLIRAERLVRGSKQWQRKWMAAQAGVPVGGALLDGREWHQFPEAAA